MFEDKTILVTIPIIEQKNIYNIEIPVTVIPDNDDVQYEVKNKKVAVYLKVDGDKNDDKDFKAFIDLNKLNISLNSLGKGSVIEKEVPITVQPGKKDKRS